MKYGEYTGNFNINTNSDVTIRVDGDVQLTCEKILFNVYKVGTLTIENNEGHTITLAGQHLMDVYFE